MIGYHYTTNDAWAKIQVEGLMPQPKLDSPFRTHPLGIEFPDKIIWLFNTPCATDFEIRGQIIFTLVKHNVMAERVVELAVVYTQKHLAPVYRTLAPGEILDITHDGSLGTIIGGIEKRSDYHHKQSTILSRVVKPSDVYLSRSWKVFTPVNG